MSEATEKLAELEARALSELKECAEEAGLRLWHTRFFGDKGEMALALRAVSTIPKEQRKDYGQEANRVKVVLTTAYDSALAEAKERTMMAGLTANPLDVTLPGRAPCSGPPACGHASHARNLWHLLGHGLSNLSHARGRGRSNQFRAAEHAAAPSGTRYVGYLPYHYSGSVIADAYFARSDSRHEAALPAADPGCFAGNVLSL